MTWLPDEKLDKSAQGLKQDVIIWRLKRKIPKPIEMKMKERRESAEDVMQTDQSGSRTKEGERGKYVREDHTEIRCDSDSAENSGEFTANHLSVVTFIAGETPNCRHVQIRPFYKAF